MANGVKCLLSYRADVLLRNGHLGQRPKKNDQWDITRSKGEKRMKVCGCANAERERERERDRRAQGLELNKMRERKSGGGREKKKRELGE